MNNKEKEAIMQAIIPMTEEEKKVVLSCIPVHMMLDYIQSVFNEQEKFINAVKNAVGNIS